VKLELLDASGRLLSENLYWEGKDEAALRKLNALPQAAVRVSAGAMRVGEEISVRVELENTSGSSALANKLTLLDSKGVRILPAYYSDNYVSLLPGEKREIEIRYPVAKAAARARIALRGWNAKPASIAVR